MSNEIKIEDIKRDDHMYEDTHYDKSCGIVRRNGFWRVNTGGLERTLEVLAFFMVCHCRTKSENLLPIFDAGQSVNVGVSIDVHLPNKKCSFEQYQQYDGRDYYVFKCDCKCRQPSFSYPGRY
jgi:hypothetical protein